MQRVLVLSPFFHPEPISTGRYNLTMVQGLCGSGCTVTVACCHPFYPAWRVERSKAQLPEMRIIRGGGWLRFPGATMLRRLVLESWFSIFATWVVWRHRNRIDLVVAVFPPSLFFLGVTAILPKAVRRVGVIHDLQGIHAEASRSWLIRRLVGVIGWIERRGFRACDRLVVLSAAMADKLAESSGIEREHIRIVYPFVNLPGAASGIADRLAQQFPADHIHLVYSGALGEKQNPQKLAVIFEAIASGMPEVMIHVFSEGAAFDAMKSYFAERALPKVSFQALVPEEDVAELYRRADIQLIPQAAGTQHGSMPSKLPNILASGRLVLAICDDDSELATMISRFNSGASLSSWEPADVQRVLAGLVVRARSRAAEKPDIAAVRAFFSLDRLTTAILGVGSSAQMSVS